MKNIYYIFFLVIVITSCNKKSSPKDILEFKGTKIELTFDPFKVNNIKDNDFVLVDHYKFIHKSNLYQLKDSIGYFLPSLNNVIMKVESKTREEKGNVINISRAFIKNLKSTKKYRLINPQRTSLFGKIIFQRLDNKEITIRFNKSYPASIKLD